MPRRKKQRNRAKTPQSTPKQQNTQQDQKHDKRLITKYQDSYCEEIIRHGEVGMNLVEFAALIGIHRSTLYEWARKYPEFKEAMLVAKAKNEAYWWKLAKTQMKFKFNFGVWKFVMINIFGYKDVKEDDEESPEQEKNVIILPTIKQSQTNQSNANECNLDASAEADPGAGI